MEVKTGSEKTGIGIIPDDWEIKSLTEIGNFRTGPFGTLLKANEYYADEGVPLVAVKDIGEGKLNFNDATPLVPLSVVRRLPEYVLNSGDIIFGRKGNVNRTAIVQASQAGCFLGSDGIRVRLSKICHPSFVVYQLQMKYIQAWLLQNATGTTMPSMNQSILRRISLPFPPTLAEQKAIAEALSDTDALIEALEQLLAKKRQVKQGAMQELMSGKRRLPGFSDEWKIKQFGDLGSTFGGLSGKTKADFGHGAARYITFMNIIYNTVVDNKAFDLVKLKPTETQNKVVKGDLFFNGSSETPEEVGMCAVLLDDVDNVYVNSFCFGFRFRENVKANSLYFAYYFRSHEGRELMKSLAQGAIRYNLSKTALLKLSFPMPEYEEQTAIAEILSDMDAEIAALEGKLSKARQVKQGMMSVLLTGRIRLV